MSYLEEILAKRTACIGFIGIRGASKTWTATRVLELLRMRGWRPLIVDVKGEDETLHLPARDNQARKLRAHGVQPRGWDVEYLTFNFPLAMNYVPVRFRLAPISVNMLSYSHFRTLGGFLTPSEARDLLDAYYSAGGPSATLEDMIEGLLRRKGENVSPRLLAFLTSGFLDDSSPLEPERLVETVQRRDFTVLSTAYFHPSSLELGRFGLNVVLDNLMGHLVQRLEEARVIVHFRELRQVAPRVGAFGSTWHLRARIENFVTLLRQTKTALTRVFYEVQDVRGVPKTILDNTQAVFVHPMNLKQERERKELANYFPIPESVIHTIAPMRKAEPGKWVFLTKSGHAELVTVLPPASLRMPEPRSPEDAGRLRRLYDELVPRRELREELREALRKYRFWQARAYILQKSVEELGLYLPEGELPPPETMILNKIPKMFAIFVKVFKLKAPLDGREEINFNASQVARWAGEVWGLWAHQAIAPSRLEKMIRSKRNRLQLRIAGFSFWRDTEGNLGGTLNVERYLAHMRAHESEYDKAIRPPSPRVYKN